MIGLIITILICGMIIMTLNDKSARKDELEYAVSAAAQQSVEYAYPLTKNKIYSDEDIKAIFVQNFFVNIQSESNKIKIDFITVDCEKGLLDVCVTEEFTYPGGKIGTISVRKTAICE